MSSARPRPVVLCILDGFGERAERDDNAVRMAKSPRMDALFAGYPHGLIGTSGPDVGLPVGQMGNSEVGHMNFGAGRIAMMDISRIDVAVADGSLGKNAVIARVMDAAKGARLHLFGLVSDGGVHSSLVHLLALLEEARARGVVCVVHAFLDGRDVMPGTAVTYLAALEEKLASMPGSRIGTVSGRYYAMDRDNRWERVERAYRAIVEAKGPRFASARAGVLASFDAQKTDEFVEPFVVDGYGGVKPGDAGLHTNFRPDRARELSAALASPSFAEFERVGNMPPLATYACMTTYDTRLALPVAFPKETYPDIFPEVLAAHGMTQFRCAETEKYAHVTYFFNGGREEPFAGEERKMLPSPKDVDTYDKKPEMSARAVTEAVVAAVDSGRFDFILVNFANPDMVGHTGDLGAAIEAVEAVDIGVGALADAVRARGGVLFLTADHGNCELMKDPATGQPHTAHTLNPVPLLYMNDADTKASVRAGGRICDVAPTILTLMGLPVPPSMTGRNLLERR